MAIQDDDLAAVLLELERRLSRDEIAATLEVDGRELDEIASGYPPSRSVARRLRALAAGDEAAGATTRRLPRGVIVAFVAADLVVFAIVAALVLLR